MKAELLATISMCDMAHFMTAKKSEVEIRHLKKLPLLIYTEVGSTSRAETAHQTIIQGVQVTNPIEVKKDLLGYDLVASPDEVVG